MSIVTPLSYPKNDSELNEVIRNINLAYSKYFDLYVSSKRSNKLRDCICEGLGFTNGGYQQLLSLWAANESYDFSDINLVEFIHAPVNPKSGMVIAKPFSNKLIHFLFDYFNFENSSRFTDGDSKGNYGWEYGDHNKDDLISIVKDSMSSNNLHPIFYDNFVIGYAFDKSFAEIINAITFTAFLEGNKFSLGSLIIKPWRNYISKVEKSNILIESKNRVIVLRQSSAEYGLSIPYDKISILFDKIVIEQGSRLIEILHDKEKDVAIFNGMEFDFISSHALSSDGYFHLDSSNKKISSFECFLGSRVEIIPLDCDIDDLISVPINTSSLYISF